MKIPFCSKFTGKLFLLAAIVLCVFLRMYHINSNEFIFYDEGMYLDYYGDLLQLIQSNPPKNLGELLAILQIMWKKSLLTAKAFWFFLIGLRVFLTGAEGYYFSRVISAVFGLATVGLTYVWTKRYYQCNSTALLSAFVLAFLPSHVFYSRLGMQESLCAFLLLYSLYMYQFSKHLWQSAFAAVVMFAVFMTNYRMVIGPVFIVALALLDCRFQVRQLDYKKLGMFLGVYLACFLLIALIEGGVNLKVNVMWMFNQAEESSLYRNWYNIFSYPYYIWRLDGPLFLLLIVFSLWFMVRERFQRAAPLLIVAMQIGLFSLAAEKGARYLCVVLPFACMSVAHILKHMYEKNRKAAVCCAAGLFVTFLYLSWPLVLTQTGYKTAVEWLQHKDRTVKFLSTQPRVTGLFLHYPQKVAPLPKNLQETAVLVKQGFRFLVLDPQLYVSWTKDGRRFQKEELEFLSWLRVKAPLVYQSSHLNKAHLERFVFDHSQDLVTSIKFLEQQKGTGDIFIYDLGV